MSQFQLVRHIGPYALICCLVKGGKKGYFVIDVSKKEHILYQLKYNDLNNFVGLALPWEEEKDDYDEQLDIPFAVTSDLISKWEKEV